MSVKSSHTHTLGVVARAFDLLVTLAGDTLAEVTRCFQRIIDDPGYRRRIWLVMTGKLVVDELTMDEWIEREINVMKTLGLFDEETARQIETMANRVLYNLYSTHYFVPKGLTRERLIELARGAGIKIDDSPHRKGEELPTEAGILWCLLSEIMVPTDDHYRPFNLNYEQHERWVKELGGDKLTSVEEMLYLLIRQCMVSGRVLFMGGSIRCRNSRDANDSLTIGAIRGGINDGLSVGCTTRSLSHWTCGAVAQQFTPLDPVASKRKQ